MSYNFLESKMKMEEMAKNHEDHSVINIEAANSNDAIPDTGEISTLDDYDQVGTTV